MIVTLAYVISSAQQSQEDENSRFKADYISQAVDWAKQITQTEKIKTRI